MKIAVIGTGGVGGYFGGKLAKGGHEVAFIARGEHLRALQNNGLLVKSVQGDFRINKVMASDDISTVAGAGLIILGIKAWQVSEVSHLLKPHISPDTVILPLQNGILAFDEIQTALGGNHAIKGLCRIFSKIESPGIITHLGIEPSIIFGEADNSKTKRIESILDLFEQSQIKARIADDIETELWKKFINICVSGLLAVSRSTYGQIREIKESRALMIRLFEEIYQLSQVMGININHDFIDKTVAFVDTFDYNATSSLTRDVWEGKPSEIEYQNGTVVKLAEKYNLSVPVNQFVYYCILPMEKRARENAAH